MNPIRKSWLQVIVLFHALPWASAASQLPLQIALMFAKNYLFYSSKSNGDLEQSRTHLAVYLSLSSPRSGSLLSFSDSWFQFCSENWSRRSKIKFQECKDITATLRRRMTAQTLKTSRHILTLPQTRILESFRNWGTWMYLLKFIFWSKRRKQDIIA